MIYSMNAETTALLERIQANTVRQGELAGSLSKSSIGTPHWRESFNELQRLNDTIKADFAELQKHRIA